MLQTFRGPRDNVHVYENDVIGTTIPSVWLYGGAHYWQTKGWLRQHVLRWCLDGVWLWAVCLISWTSVASPLESADAFLSPPPRVRHFCPSSADWRHVGRQVFQWKRTPEETERASPASHAAGLTSGGTREAEVSRESGERDVFGLFTALWHLPSNRRSLGAAGWECPVLIFYRHWEYMRIQGTYNRIFSFRSLETWCYRSQPPLKSLSKHLVWPSGLH